MGQSTPAIYDRSRKGMTRPLDRWNARKFRPSRGNYNHGGRSNALLGSFRETDLASQSRNRITITRWIVNSYRNLAVDQFLGQQDARSLFYHVGIGFVGQSQYANCFSRTCLALYQISKPGDLCAVEEVRSPSDVGRGT